MSFRDLRNLSELLRSIGYPRLISLENFRSPNFKLVAEICQWLIKQYEPNADESMYSIENEAGRVRFITYFAEFMLKQTQIKLNTKRLYQADGYAVKELIKVANGLDATKSQKLVNFNDDGASEGTTTANGDDDEPEHAELANNIEELKRTRNLGIEITQRGGTLYDLLSKEITLREARYKALSKAFDLNEVERVLQSAIKASTTELSKSESMLENVVSNVTAVQLKIDKKRAELERSEKRLQTLKKVRPAFMDEYEKLQAELEKSYREYVVRFRVLSCLQNQVEEMSRLDSERKAEERLIKQELATADDLLLYHQRSMGRGGGANIYGGIDGDEDEDDEDDLEGSEENSIQYNAREFMLSRGGSLSRMRGGPAEQLQSQRRTGKKDVNNKTNGPKAPTVNGNGRRTANNNNKPKQQMYGDDDDDEDEETDSDVLLLEDNLDQSELLSDDIDDDDEDDDDIDDELMQMGSLDMSGSNMTKTNKKSGNPNNAPLIQTARKPKPNDSNSSDPSKTYRREKSSFSNSALSTMMMNGAAGGAHVIVPVIKGTTVQAPPPAPSTSSVTLYNGGGGGDEYFNESLNNSYINHNHHRSTNNDDSQLIMPNGMIKSNPQPIISYISDEVDGFGDSSLTKPLEAPKTTIVPSSSGINSLTYRKSSRTKSKSHRGLSSGLGTGASTSSGSFGDGGNNSSGQETMFENELNVPTYNDDHHRKKSSSKGHSSRSRSSSKSSSSSSSTSHHRPESKSKGHHNNNHHSGSNHHHHPPSVVEEEQEGLGGSSPGDIEYPIPSNYQLERPPSRPGSHYAKSRTTNGNNMLMD